MAPLLALSFWAELSCLLRIYLFLIVNLDNLFSAGFLPAIIAQVRCVSIRWTWQMFRLFLDILCRHLLNKYWRQ